MADQPDAAKAPPAAPSLQAEAKAAGGDAPKTTATPPAQADAAKTAPAAAPAAKEAPKDDKAKEAATAAPEVQKADERPQGDRDPPGGEGAGTAATHDADKESTTQAIDMGKSEGGTGEDSVADIEAKGGTINVKHPFTLRRDNGTEQLFQPGLHRDLSPEDYDHWYVRANSERVDDEPEAKAD